MYFDITPTVKRLLIANFALYGLCLLAAFSYHIDLNAYLGLHSFFSKEFHVYQFVSYMFMHAYVQNGQIYIFHIFSNMFALFMFGPMLERYWGPKRFLFFYMFTGIGAGLSYWAVNAYEVYHLKLAVMAYLENPSPDHFVQFLSHFNDQLYKSNIAFIEHFSEHPHDAMLIQETTKLANDIYNQSANFSMVGASGSVFGILMGFALLFPNTELMLLFPPIPIKAKYMVGFYILWELYAQLQQAPDDNIAHFAHLAGAAFAFILVRYWNKQRNSFY
jgi:membrane associated rhomboid family serine protease